MRLILLVLSTLCVASVISITGVISFVGLIAPHVTYLWTRNRCNSYLLLSGLVGAIIVVGADCLARSIGSGELPISVLTTLLGAPVLLWLLWCSRGGRDVTI